MNHNVGLSKKNEPSPPLPSPPFDKVMQFATQMRTNFDRKWGGLRSLAHWRASFPTNTSVVIKLY